MTRPSLERFLVHYGSHTHWLVNTMGKQSTKAPMFDMRTRRPLPLSLDRRDVQRHLPGVLAQVALDLPLRDPVIQKQFEAR